MTSPVCIFTRLKGLLLTNLLGQTETTSGQRSSLSDLPQYVLIIYVFLIIYLLACCLFCESKITISFQIRMLNYCNDEEC